MNSRLILIGNEATGKTSLCRRLAPDQAGKFNKLQHRLAKIQTVLSNRPNYEKTDGIQMFDTTIPPKNFVKLKLLDFAGQEIYRGTHGFFLEGDALFTLVLDLRTIDSTMKDQLLAWFHLLSVRAKPNQKAQVLAVGTHLDKFSTNIQKQVQTDFRVKVDTTSRLFYDRIDIVSSHSISNFTEEGIPEFQQAIHNYFWDLARKEVETNSGSHSAIVSLTEFQNRILKKCEEFSAGLELPLIEQSQFREYFSTLYDDQFENQAIEVLNRKGIIVDYRSQMNAIVLDPKWLADVFKLAVSHRYKNPLISDEELNKRILQNPNLGKSTEKIKQLLVDFEILHSNFQKPPT